MAHPQFLKNRGAQLLSGSALVALCVVLLIWFVFKVNLVFIPQSVLNPTDAIANTGYSLRWTPDAQAKLTAEQLLPSLPDESASSRWLSLEADTVLPTGPKSAAWLHLRMPKGIKTEQLYLEFNRARVLKIDAFLRNVDGKWIKQSAGFTVPFSLRSLPTQHPTFAVLTNPEISTDYLFRVQHIAPVVLAPRLIDSVKFAASSRENGVHDGAILGGLLSFILACALAVFITRWSGFCWPALIAICTVFVFGPTLGLTSRWVWPNNGLLDRTLSWSASTILTLATILMLIQLQYHKNVLQNRAQQVLIIFAMVLAVTIGLHFLYPTLITLAWHRGLSLAITLTTIYLLIRHARASVPWLNLTLVGLVLVAAISVPRWLRALGWIENADWFELGAALVYTAQCILLFFGMLESVRLRQTDNAITRALSPIDVDTGLHTWRVCKEALARVTQHANNANQSSSMVLIQLHAERSQSGNEPVAAPKQLCVALAHRVRAAGEPLDSVGLRGDNLIYWIIERPLTSAQLVQLGHKIRVSHARPYPQFDATAQHNVTMVCCFNPPSKSTVDQLVDQAATAAELASEGLQRTIKFMVFE